MLCANESSTLSTAPETRMSRPRRLRHRDGSRAHKRASIGGNVGAELGTAHSAEHERTQTFDSNEMLGNKICGNRSGNGFIRSYVQ